MRELRSAFSQSLNRKVSSSAYIHCPENYPISRVFGSIKFSIALQNTRAVIGSIFDHARASAHRWSTICAVFAIRHFGVLEMDLYLCQSNSFPESYFNRVQTSSHHIQLRRSPG